MKTKLKTLMLSLSPNDSFNIIVFVETWLNDHIEDAAIGLETYIIFRQDRNPLNSKSAEGVVFLSR